MAYEKLIESLRAKGWSTRDIQEAIRILNEAPKHKNSSILMLDGAVYWIALLLMIIGNIVISIILIPTLMVLTTVSLYIIVIVIASAFGTMFNLLLRETENIQGRRIIAGLFIPALALINVYYITVVSNAITKNFRIQNVHDPIVFGGIYAICFLLPYILYSVARKITIL